MGSRVVEQVNPWGREKGEEPQRSDLWVVDFRSALSGIQEIIGAELPPVRSYHVQSVSLPALAVKADAVRRDSRSYQMPSFDEPLDAVRMVFVLDVQNDVDKGSHVYQFLDKWRRVVRAGRGALGTEPEITLDANYRINYAFNVYVILLAGGTLTGTTGSAAPSQVQAAANSPTASQSFYSRLFSTRRNSGSLTSYQQAQDHYEAARQEREAWLIAQNQNLAQPGNDGFLAENNLAYSGFYVLEKCWLSSFKFVDLSYGENKLLTIEAQFYVENILDKASVQ